MDPFEDEPYEDEDYEWYSPYPMHIYAKKKGSKLVKLKNNESKFIRCLEVGQTYYQVR